MCGRGSLFLCCVGFTYFFPGTGHDASVEESLRISQIQRQQAVRRAERRDACILRKRRKLKEMHMDHVGSFVLPATDTVQRAFQCGFGCRSKEEETCRVGRIGRVRLRWLELQHTSENCLVGCV